MLNNFFNAEFKSPDTRKIAPWKIAPGRLHPGILPSGKQPPV